MHPAEPTVPENPIEGAKRSEDSFIKNYEDVAQALFAWSRLHVRPALRRFIEAEDILQEVCCRAFDGFAEFDPRKGNFRSWIFGIAHNVLRENLRRIGRNRETRIAPEKWPSLASLPDDATSISQRIVRDENLKAFVAQLEKLGEDERRLLLYRGLEGMSHAEIASLLDVSLDAVEKRWQRLLKKIRAISSEASVVLIA